MDAVVWSRRAATHQYAARTMVATRRKRSSRSPRLVIGGLPRHALAPRVRRAYELRTAKHPFVLRGARRPCFVPKRQLPTTSQRSGITQRHTSDPTDPGQGFVSPRHHAPRSVRSSGAGLDHWHGSATSFAGGLPQLEVNSEYADRSSRSYRLEIVQHPLKAAEFGSSTLSRLALAPPLIAQLFYHDQYNPDAFDDHDLPFLIAHLSLYSADGSTALDVVGPGGQTPSRQLLYGSLVSSPHILRNLQGRMGVYFLFPDASNPVCGIIESELNDLCRVSPGGMFNMTEQGVLLAHARSRAFDVYSRAEYVAPAQTPLTQYFLQQGVRMTASCTVQRP